MYYLFYRLKKLLKKAPAGTGRFLSLLALVLLVDLSFASCAQEETILLEEAGEAGAEGEKLPEGTGSSAEDSEDKTTNAPANDAGENDLSQSEALKRQNEAGSAADGQDTEQAREQGMIYVFVCGAVEKEGVYELPEGARVFEALQAAGGFAEDASTDYINLAEPVYDGAKLRIPTAAEAAELREQEDPAEMAFEGTLASSADHAGDGTESSGTVNINTASLSELQELPGIGEEKAKAIAAYREEHGAFSDISEITQVQGIKSGTYEKLKEYITVR